MSMNSIQYFIGILSPLLLTYIIVYVTGIPLLEANMRIRK